MLGNKQQLLPQEFEPVYNSIRNRPHVSLSPYAVKIQINGIWWYQSGWDSFEDADRKAELLRSMWQKHPSLIQGLIVVEYSSEGDYGTEKKRYGLAL